MYIYLKFIILVYILTSFSQQALAQGTTWERIYPGDREENSTSSCQLSDGNFMLAGYIRDPEFKIYLLKINQYGDTLWSKKIPGSTTWGCQAAALLPTSDNSFVITGELDNSVFLMKLSNEGDILWHREYTHLSSWYGNQILQDTDGGYIIKGNYFILKVNSSGIRVWDKIDPIRRVISITTGINGGVVAAYFFIQNNQYRRIARKYNTVNGAQVWEKNLDLLEIPTEIKTKGNQYVIFGFNYGSTQDSSSLFISHLDTNLVIKKYLSFKFLRYEITEDGFSLLPGNKYAFATYSTRFNIQDTNILVLRIIGENGNILFQKEILNKNSGYNVINTVSSLPNNDILFTGYYKGQLTGRNEEFYAIRTDSILNFKSTTINSTTEIVKDYIIHEPFPNPFNPQVNISFNLAKLSDVVVKIFDINGRLVEILVNDKLQRGKHLLTYSSQTLSSGIYFISYSINRNHETKKITIIK